MSDTEQMLTNGKSLYWDERTVKVLQSHLEETAMNGDVFTMKSIVEALGPHQVTDAKNNMRKLVANLQDTDKFTLDNYYEMLKELGYSVDDLLKDTTNDITAYDGPVTTVMTAANTVVVDDAIGSDLRKLIVTATYVYNS